MINFEPIIQHIHERFPYRKLDISIQQPVDGFAPEIVCSNGNGIVDSFGQIMDVDFSFDKWEHLGQDTIAAHLTIWKCYGVDNLFLPNKFALAYYSKENKNWTIY